MAENQQAQTAGAQGTTGAQGQSGAPAKVAPPFDPRVNIDTRVANSQGNRAPDFRPTKVVDVRRYRDKRTGSPRVAFNQGSIHISMKQMNSAGVFYPETLVGKTIMLDFFKPGDILLNGSGVTDDGRIVNRFLLEPDMAVAREIEKTLALEAHSSWASSAGLTYGANTRGSGIGTGLSDSNGTQAAAAIPAQADLNAGGQRSAENQASEFAGGDTGSAES